MLQHEADAAFIPSPRLFQVKAQKNKRVVTEVPLSTERANYNDDDVFILDLGNVIYEIVGANSSSDEKYRAADTVNLLLSSPGREATKYITTRAPLKHPDIARYFKKESLERPAGQRSGSKLKLFRISDKDGSLDMDPVENVSKDSLEHTNVYVLDSANGVYVWVGDEASRDEKRNALAYVKNYLSKTETPYKEVFVIPQGKESEAFNAAWSTQS
jgi:gelsolin